MRASCSPSSSAIRRCAAASRSTTSAAPALYLLSDLSTGVTGEIHFVNSGYNVIAMPHPDALRADHARPADDAVK